MNELIQQENTKNAVAGVISLSKWKAVRKMVNKFGETLASAIDVSVKKGLENELYKRTSLNQGPKIISLERLFEIINFLNDVKERSIHEYSIYENFIIEIYYDDLSKEYKHHKICNIDNIKEMFYEEARDCFIIVQKKAKYEGMETIFITNSGVEY